MPPVSPNEWNIGIALNTRSAGLKSTTAATWAMLARMLRWLSTTPLGEPSEPEVNSTTAAESAGTAAPGSRRRASSHPRSLARRPNEARTSSSHRNRSSGSIRATTGPSFALSTNARDDRTVRTSAARQAASIASAPG